MAELDTRPLPPIVGGSLVMMYEYKNHAADYPPAVWELPREAAQALFSKICAAEKGLSAQQQRIWTRAGWQPAVLH